jgi:hypothetical protein
MGDDAYFCIVTPRTHIQRPHVGHLRTVAFGGFGWLVEDRESGSRAAALHKRQPQEHRQECLCHAGATIWELVKGILFCWFVVGGWPFGAVPIVFMFGKGRRARGLALRYRWLEGFYG